MSNEQPEAIRLSEWGEWFLKNVQDPMDFRWVRMTAMCAELRRQHAEIQRLHEERFREAAEQQPGSADTTDWKAIARVQSAKLAVALDSPGARERLRAVIASRDWKDVRLIEAAPRLLDALEAVRDRFFPADSPERDRDLLWARVNGAIAQARLQEGGAADARCVADALRHRLE